MARAFAVKIPARPHYLSLFTYRSLIYLGLQPVTYRSLSIPQAVPYLSLFTYHSLIYLGLQPVTYRSLSISPWQSLAYRTSSARSLTYLGLQPITYRSLSIPLCHPIQASLLSILIDIHFQTHWVSLSNPLGFTFKPIGFYF